MVDSLEKTVRAAIGAWVASLGLSPAPTVIQVEEPKPPAKVTLPTFEVGFGPEEWEVQYRRPAVDLDGVPIDLDGRAVWDYGGITSDAVLVWRCGSEAEAEAFRHQFRAAFLLYAEAQGTLADSPVVTLPATFFGEVPGEVSIYMMRPNNLVYPSSRETSVVDYWVLSHAVSIAFPLLVLEPEPGAGIMNVLIGIGQPEDPFDLNNYPGE